MTNNINLTAMEIAMQDFALSLGKLADAVMFSRFGDTEDRYAIARNLMDLAQTALATATRL